MGLTEKQTLNPIGRRLLKQVSVAVLGIMIVLTFIMAWLDYNRRMTILDESLEQIKSVHITGITTALWHFDKQVLKAEVEGMLLVRYVNYVAIQDSDQVIVKAGAKKDHGGPVREFPLVREHQGRPVLLGTLSIQADQSKAIQEVWDRIVLMLLFQGAMVAFVAFIFYLLFVRTVTRHLVAVADYFQRFDVNQLSAPLQLNKKQTHDEIELLAATFNTMRETLAEATQQQLSDQQKLKESEERFRLLIEQAPEAIVVYDCDEDRFVDANAKAEQLFGCSRKELLQSNPQKFYSPSQPDGRSITESMEENIERVLAGEKLIIERRIHTADGRDLITEARLVRFPTAGRRQIRNSYLDITERKQAEEKQQALADEIRLLLESTGEGIIGVDSQSCCTFINQAGADMLGYLPQEIQGKSIHPLIHHHHADGSVYPEEDCPMHYTLQKGGAFHWDEDVLWRKNGTYFWTEYSSYPILERGEVKGAVIVFVDNTESRKIEEALRKSRENYRSLAESSPDAIMRYDRQGRHIYVNAACAKMAGIPAEEFVGKTHRELGFDKKQSDFWEEKILSIFETGQSEQIDLSFEGADGQIYLDWLLVPEFSQTGHPETVLGISRDITARKQVEERLKVALKEKEVLLRELYHRTKNNMQVISSLLQLQKAQAQDDFISTAFLEMQNRIQSMSLIHKKLYQSQDLTFLNLGDYISDLADLVRESYLASSEKIAIIVEAEEIKTSIDTAIPCGLIVNELISNAFKHAFPGDRKGEIHIRLKKIEGGFIELDISDNGVGPKPDFDFRGNGRLGLQMVLTLGENQLGGTVRFESNHGLACQIRFQEGYGTARV